MIPVRRSANVIFNMFCCCGLFCGGVSGKEGRGWLGWLTIDTLCGCGCDGLASSLEDFERCLLPSLGAGCFLFFCLGRGLVRSSSFLFFLRASSIERFCTLLSVLPRMTLCVSLSSALACSSRDVMALLITDCFCLSSFTTVL